MIWLETLFLYMTSQKPTIPTVVCFACLCKEIMTLIGGLNGTGNPEYIQNEMIKNIYWKLTYERWLFSLGMQNKNKYTIDSIWIWTDPYWY